MRPDELIERFRRKDGVIIDLKHFGLADICGERPAGYPVEQGLARAVAATHEKLDPHVPLGDDTWCKAMTRARRQPVGETGQRAGERGRDHD